MLDTDGFESAGAAWLRAGLESNGFRNEACMTHTAEA
jgi:hypothetical protein